MGISYITCTCITTVIRRILVFFLPVIFCHCEWDWSVPSSLPPTFLPSFLLACALCEVVVSEPYWFQKEFGSHHFFCDSEWFTWCLIVPPLCEWELNAIMHVKILDEWPACNKHWTNISYDETWLDVNSRYQLFLTWVKNASLYKSRESKCPRAIISPSFLPLTPPPP